MLVAVAFYEVVIALHILAVVLAFGATFAYPVIFAVAAKEPRALPTVYRAIHAISQRVISPGLALVVIFGIYLASKLHLWSSFFVQWGLGVAIVIGAVEGMYLGPREKRLIAVSEAEVATAGPDGEVQQSDEHKALARSVGVVGGLMDVLVVLTIYFMVTRTGA
ncbi:MAG TPA: hypothetical protein VN817_02660 [Solirubrobacteraceae bacterium]|nr:hypothetical protein [Solirubrobacteraceae bacterium]